MTVADGQRCMICYVLACSGEIKHARTCPSAFKSRSSSTTARKKTTVRLGDLLRDKR